MTASSVATAHWRRLNGDGTDRCSLARVDMGWILTGEADWIEKGVEIALTYAVRADPDWQTLSADVAGQWGERPVNLRIQRTEGGWMLNDVPQRVGAEARDVDLSFTPATNLLAIRRLALNGGGPAHCTAAWLMPGLDRLAPLKQTYTRRADGACDYASASFAARLDVHETGFVTHYPGYWEGWVDD